MKPLGRQKMRYNYPDNHYRIKGKRVTNWWEEENQPSKKRARQQAKREIRDEQN